MASIYGEVFLPCHKGKASSELQQKFLQMVDQCLFQCGFIVMLIGREIKELEYIGVFNDLFVFRLRFQAVDLRSYAVLIAAGKDPIVVHGVDLTLQLADAPAGFCRFRCVEPARLTVFHSNQQAVMGLAQFMTECVTVRKGQIKLLHIAQVGNVKSSSELCRQLFGNFLQHLLAVGCPLGIIIITDFRQECKTELTREGSLQISYIVRREFMVFP